MSKLYVAYGSNLNLQQMAHRCPTARIKGKGILNNWELLFRGAPSNSHATIRRKYGCTVPVLVWEIQDEDEKNLDIYEGYPRYYYKQNVYVEINGDKKKAMVYIMDASQKAGRPSHQYERIIRQGYLDNGFDMDYFDRCIEKNIFECKRS